MNICSTATIRRSLLHKQLFTKRTAQRRLPLFPCRWAARYPSNSSSIRSLAAVRNLTFAPLGAPTPLSLTDDFKVYLLRV